jgi:phospholipase A-2-activating protein
MASHYFSFVFLGSECVQSLLHPAGIWYLTLLENGDLVTAGHDGVIRIWTQDPSRALPPNEIKEYEQKIASRAISKSGMVGDLRLADLPTLDSLNIPGKKDGDQRIVRNGDKAELYYWDAAAQQWQKIGDITDAVNTPNDKRKLNGKVYDYVFDVDLGDGNPPRKLGYNANENPYVVAQEFIQREQINQGYLDQIAKFIMDNTSPVTIGQQPTVDIPFAANRYIPGGNPAQYKQPQQSQQNISSSSTKYFPLKECVLFESANYNAIVEKIKQFNKSLLENASLKNVSLTSEELSFIETTMNTLKNTSYYHVSSFSENEFNTLLKAFISWPDDKRFPILDVYRLLILHPEAAKTFDRQGTLKEPLLSMLLTRDLQTNSPAANKLLAFRFIANCFCREFLHATLLSFQEKIFERIAEISQTKHEKNLSVAFATVILNFSVVYLLRRANMDSKLQCVSIVSELLNNEDDSEAVFRLLVALGTLIYEDMETLKVFKDLGVLSAIEKQTYSSVTKVKECATDLKTLFSK